jgi:hypothetical protein
VQPIDGHINSVLIDNVIIIIIIIIIITELEGVGAVYQCSS